ncbi:MAG: response regulator [Gemmatimonadota bacterium]|nr:MAG: response regulator [Gemmatimonadota bacterium]
MVIAADTATKTVLAVDDESRITALVRELLEREGQSVEMANGGETAIRKIDEDYFDAVFSDPTMPVQSGAEIDLQCQEKNWDIIAPGSSSFSEKKQTVICFKTF